MARPDRAPRTTGTAGGIFLIGGALTAVAVSVSGIISDVASIFSGKSDEANSAVFLVFGAGIFTVSGFTGAELAGFNESACAIAVQACPVAALKRSPIGQATGLTGICGSMTSGAFPEESLGVFRFAGLGTDCIIALHGLREAPAIA